MTELVLLQALGEAVAHATGGAVVGLVSLVGFEVAPELGSQCVGTGRASCMSAGAHEHAACVGLKGPSHTQGTSGPSQYGR